MAPNSLKDDDDSLNLQKINQFVKKEILYDGNLYDVRTFVHRHPGGHEILLNFTEAGEDATLAIQQFHSRSIDKVLSMLKSLPNRPEPQIKLSEEMKQVRQRNAEMTADFVKLYAEIKEEGLFKPSIPHWIYRFVELLALGFLGLSLITLSSNFFSRLSGSFLLAMAMGRGAWMMHELGHISATGNPKLDRFFQDIILGGCIGMSGIWWRRHHNIHHAKPNRVDADPDLELLPGLFIFNPKMLKDPVKDQTFFERNQMYFLPFYTVVLYFRWTIWDTMPYLFRKRKIVEIISISCHYFIMYQIGFNMWLTTVSIFSYYLYYVLILSHTFAPVTDGPMHWVEQSFVNTVNVAPGRRVDWLMGYINYQIEHHLFPTLPQFRSPLIVDRVKELAQKHGFPYHADSLRRTVRKTLGNFKRVSHFLKSIG